RDVAAVKVFSTDELLVDGLDGRAFELDPGKYKLRFVYPGGEVLSSDVVVREGEKNRLIQVRKDKPAASAATRDETAREPKSLGPAPWIAAGLGVAALASGVTLGVMGSSKRDTLEQCKPYCPASDQSTYDGAKGLFLGADISFGVAAVAAGVATWLFVSGLSHDEPATTPVVSFVPGG